MVSSCFFTVVSLHNSDFSPTAAPKIQWSKSLFFAYSTRSLDGCLCCRVPRRDGRWTREYEFLFRTSAASHKDHHIKIPSPQIRRRFTQICRFLAGLCSFLQILCITINLSHNSLAEAVVAVEAVELRQPHSISQLQLGCSTVGQPTATTPSATTPRLQRKRSPPKTR